MQHSSSSMRLKNICICLTIATFSAISSAATGLSVSAAADRPAIIAGEPLFITLTITNSSGSQVYIRTDSYAFDRVITGPNGVPSRLAMETPPPDYGYFPQALAPGTEKTIRFVATEIAKLRRPGGYQMSITYAPLHISAALRFVIEPYDEAALRARAEELSTGANASDEQGKLNENALIAMDRDISRPLLCTLLKSGREGVLSAQKLAQFGDTDSASCLIDVLPLSHGMQREAVVGALEQIARRIADKNLQERIDHAIRSR
jgi:hypothetical protein